MKIRIAYFTNGVEKAAEELTDEIIKFTRGTKAYGGVVGLSGGIDSTTVAYLCKYAFDKEETQKRKLQLCGVVMPSDANNLQDAEDGLKVIKNLGIEGIVVPIESIAREFISKIPEIENFFEKGNLYSEIRAIVLSRISSHKNYRVMGTGNRDEDYILGYFTKRGDGAVDNNILGNLPKRLVRDLARYLKVPEYFVNRIPTAGLWKDQTDEKELGYTYEQAELIQNGFDQGYDEKQIQEITGFKMEIILDLAKRHKNTEHKRNVPPVGKVNLSYE